VVEVLCPSCVVRVPAVGLALVWSALTLGWGLLALAGVGRDGVRELLRRATT
jgi:hypothetical protein